MAGANGVDRAKRFFSLRRELKRLKEMGIHPEGRWIYGKGWLSGYNDGNYEGQREALLAGIAKMGGE